MKTYLTSGIVAALVASAAFVGPAGAQDYGQDYSQDYMMTAPPQGDAPNLDDTSVDRMPTGSIQPVRPWVSNEGADTDIDNSQDSGDFYNGVIRPQD
ncbi:MULTISPECIES: hypothetical protein [Rhizobium/Agrobacterium group]|uniref:Uncharacterized protein n=1 Tax=Neorhizobium phenanthreniclasticum TaxID=3157917 RepID=A0ABV0M2K9_9HYPH|nr:MULTISPECIES: hypothetical protein [Rhizobium/Agrobacterium group]KGD85756.1 hypothetical protein JL39_26445 [Rhizobium sp. YS-1r]MBP1843741.1 hypothetical protein [Neorhizobium petrolearium]